MIRSFIKEFFDFNNKVMNMINTSLMISSILGIIGLVLMIIYNTYSVIYDFYDGGLILLEAAFKLSAETVGLGIFVNKMMKK